MKQLKQMKETLMSAVQGQLSNLSQANTEELGCAIDMIKDLSEAIYYCTITKSMEEADEEKEEMMKMMKYQQNGNGNGQQQPVMYFQERIREPYYMPRDMDRGEGRMYYNGGGNSNGGNSNSSNSSSGSGNNARGGGTRGYSEPTYMNERERDPREGRAPERRRMYMESKQMHADKAMHMKELDSYAHELTNDILEMIQDASPEEKQALKKKIIELTGKM